jgi:hypothetical protein
MSALEHEDFIEELFHQARNLPTEEQSRCLDERCREYPPEVRELAERLLKEYRVRNQDLAQTELPTDIGRIVRPLLGEGDEHLPGQLANDTNFNSAQSLSDTSDYWNRASSSSRSSLPGRVGKYRVLQQLPGGGQAAPLLVHDPDVDRPVVLKRYYQRGLEVENQLLHEARSLAKIRSPYVATCHAVEKIDGGLYLIMEYVPGEPLKEYALREAISHRRIAELIALIAKGLLDIHNSGVLHRDVKPANILVRRNGMPCLVEFGLALPLGHVIPEQLAGTLPYMSPEQANCDEIMPHSDVFSLGAVLYELLTGVPPYSGSRSEVLDQAKQAHYRRPREINPTVPQALEDICLMAMARDPAQRYATADTLHSALISFSTQTNGPQCVSQGETLAQLSTPAYFCYISHEKVEQLFAQCDHDRPATTPDGSCAISGHRTAFLANLAYGQPNRLHFGAGTKREYVRKLLHVVGSIESEIANFDWLESSASSVWYRYCGAFRVEAVDNDQLIASLITRDNDRALTLHCSLKYFSETAEHDGRPSFHSANYAFFKKQIPVSFYSVFMLAYASASKDIFVGSPLFLAASIDRLVCL